MRILHSRNNSTKTQSTSKLFYFRFTLQPQSPSTLFPLPHIEYLYATSILIWTQQQQQQNVFILIRINELNNFDITGTPFGTMYPIDIIDMFELTSNWAPSTTHRNPPKKKPILAINLCIYEHRPHTKLIDCNCCGLFIFIPQWNKKKRNKTK